MVVRNFIFYHSHPTVVSPSKAAAELLWDVDIRDDLGNSERPRVGGDTNSRRAKPLININGRNLYM